MHVLLNLLKTVIRLWGETCCWNCREKSGYTDFSSVPLHTNPYLSIICVSVSLRCLKDSGGESRLMCFTIFLSWNFMSRFMTYTLPLLFIFLNLYVVLAYWFQLHHFRSAFVDILRQICLSHS
jgi:hypothetical protein